MTTHPHHRLTLTVPGIPPSVNHYKVPKIIRRGKFHSLIFMETAEAQEFKLKIRIAAAGRTIAPVSDKERNAVRYIIRAVIYLGKGQRGDGDNFWKVVADSVAQAGVIHSDARIADWHLYVRDDQRENPRTVVTVKVKHA